ncbi:hypothetical protein D8T51_23465 [Vibrio vulnificus]|uniref:hypothetical protein n=4 Tax=Vibrio vulnificus TaxID=672 RepID=UPI0005778FB9|nr:hypothetical protein [Vibrio vulnificus]EGR0636414.1 hypothetical protein [Vibrio vulnificus]EIJ0946798.1 hypothetical protein [Vibrio vulnificus]EIZ1007907.1 hypothetical protein [Vibrio vulnificus]EJA3101402.1 hypothetical protein [Vibrio vulnificus]
MFKNVPKPTNLSEINMRHFLITMFLSTFSFYSYSCDKSPIMPLVEDTSVSYVFEGIDTESGENILRYYYIFSDGDQLIFENQYCLMNNYDIQYSSSSLSFDKIKSRTNTIINEIKNKHNLVVNTDFLPTWFKNSNKLGGMIEAQFDTLEVQGTQERYENAILDETINLYIGIGGQH